MNNCDNDEYHYEREIEKLREKLETAVGALTTIATTRTVGYSQARQARKLAQETLDVIGFPKGRANE